MSECLIGICEEPTTYSNDYRVYDNLSVVEKKRADKKFVRTTRQIPRFTDSHDTLQKLDYPKRLSFDALWSAKEIVGTNPRTPFHEKILLNKVPRVSPTKLRELASPAVNLDDVEDPEIFKRVVDFTYKTTMSNANEEVWRDFKEADVQLPYTICDDYRNSPALKIKLIPDLPAGFKGAARKWDFLQDRRLVDRRKLNHQQSSAAHAIDAGGCSLKNSVSALGEKKLRLPYVKLPSSYGGHRTQVALAVDLEKKPLSVYHPDLTVSQVLNARRF